MCFVSYCMIFFSLNTYRVISQENFEIFHGFQVVCFEYGWLRAGVGHQILGSKQSDLWVGMDKKANKLCHVCLACEFCKASFGNQFHGRPYLFQLSRHFDYVFTDLTLNMKNNVSLSTKRLSKIDGL